MSFLDLRALPQIRFAHRFHAPSYHALIPAREGRIEISVLTAGSFRVTQDGVCYTAREGDIVLNLYGTPMAVDTDGEHGHHTVCFSVPFELRQGIKPLSVLSGKERGAACRALIDEIIRSFALRPESTLKTAGLFLQLLGEVERCLQDGDSATPGEARYVRQAKRYIFEHISEPICQRDVAAHLGITPEYLCNVFKKSEHCALMRFVNEIKLSQICAMMESKHIPLYQAALQYGFSDPNYVSRLYKKYYGRPITEVVCKS